MKLTSKTIGTWSILKVVGTVDSISTKAFIDVFSTYVSGGKKNIILDLNEATFLCIGVIRYINQISQYLDGIGGRLALMGANEKIRRHIDIFVSWKYLREVNSIWEIIPLQMEARFNEAPSEVVFEPMIVETVKGESIFETATDFQEKN